MGPNGLHLRMQVSSLAVTCAPWAWGPWNKTPRHLVFVPFKTNTIRRKRSVFLKVFHILLWEKKRYVDIDCFQWGYVGTSLKETREELVILATQTKHLCAGKINT